MKNKTFPLILLILFLINNGMSFVTQDMARAEILKDNSQPVLFIKDEQKNIKKEETEKEGEKKSEKAESEGSRNTQSSESLEKTEEQLAGSANEAMNYSDIGIPSLQELKNMVPVNMNLVGGVVTIPKIDVSINIIKGTNHENLKYGATTGLVNQKMGVGNYVLFGHNMETRGVMFSDLKELDKNDDIILTDIDMTEYKYKVVSKKVVQKNQMDVLNQSDDNIVTLINCSSVTPTGKKVSANKTPYRLVIVGELEKKV